MASSRAGSQAFPLQWPKGWKRTKSPGPSKFKTSTQEAHKALTAEIGRMGGDLVVISTNCPLKADGTMRMDREPVDSGVAVYFQRNGKGVVFACDTYDRVGHNLRAVGVTIEAMRTIERHGTSELMERAFSGFKQLKAENEGESWWKTLQVPATATAAQVDVAYKRLAKYAHPDQPGGSDVAMAALNIAREQGLSAAKGRG